MFTPLFSLLFLSHHPSPIFCNSSIRRLPKSNPLTPPQLVVAYMMGARFDIAFSRIWNGDFSKPDEGELMSMSWAAEAAAKSASRVIKETVVDATASATKAVRGEL
jgi:hypothetical protein